MTLIPDVWVFFKTTAQIKGFFKKLNDTLSHGVLNGDIIIFVQ